MPKNIVLTLTGRDKVGIVENVTSVIAKRDGNVESSRMARLGGEFAMLMLVTVSDKEFANLIRIFSNCAARAIRSLFCRRKMIQRNMRAGSRMRSK